MMHSIKTVSFPALAALALVLHVDAADEWAGRYEGYMQDARTVLTIQQQDARITGSIVDDSGYTYTIDASVNGSTAAGTLHDPAAGGTMELAAEMREGTIKLGLYQSFLGTRVTEVNVVYTPIKEGSQPGQAAKPQGVVAADLDTRLVGNWRYTSAYVSGDFSVATDYFMSIRADGTYTYSVGQMAGGSASVGFDGGSGGDQSNGQWKTQNKQIFVNEGNGWQFYANYMCDGARIMFTYPNGNKQVWERM